MDKHREKYGVNRFVNRKKIAIFASNTRQAETI